MLDLGFIDCSASMADDITRRVISSLQGVNIEAAVVRVALKSIPRSVYNGLDFHEIRQAAKPTLHFELAHELRELEQNLISTCRIGSLVDEWKQYITNAVVEQHKDELEQLALQYLTEASA